jgi:isoleucyl-tRNA synthetase
LTDFPVASFSEPLLEQQMALIQRITSLGHAIRKENNLKVRQPLSAVAIGFAPNSAEADLIFGEHAQGLTDNQIDILKQELNVKEVHETLGTPEGVTYKVLPKLPELGKKLGKQLPVAKQRFTELTEAEITAFVSGQPLELVLPEGSMFLNLDDVLLNVVMKEGFVGKAQEGLAISMDIHLTEELIVEGLAREIVNRVQNARKDAGLDVQDKIKILAHTYDNRLLIEALKHVDHKLYIMSETQALELELSEVKHNDGLDIELDDQLFLHLHLTKI